MIGRWTAKLPSLGRHSPVFLGVEGLGYHLSMEPPEASGNTLYALPVVWVCQGLQGTTADWEARQPKCRMAGQAPNVLSR
jgi:hypothetical protein